MTTKISLLSESTINQIAAGEVIEHPASVVKELVENAIDAGASHVTIETLSGGFHSIKIIDNGCGMEREDALLSLERHATSKIQGSSDLFNLSTMGFRGEALASIASISKLDLITAQEGEEAIHIKVEGGKVESVTPAARKKGTTIEVRSLFYNVPARREFQKSVQASKAEITKTLTHLSLAHPHIGFTLIQEQNRVFHLDGGSQLETRAKELLDSEFIKHSKKIELKDSECQVTGLIAKPPHSRPSRTGQYLFINNRPIQCLPLAFAMKDAYGTFLDEGRHPVYLLHLQIPPHLIDVNVHPQKKEVRLKNESLIKQALQKAVQRALLHTPINTPPPEFTPPPISAPMPLQREEREEIPSAQMEMPLLFLPQPTSIYKHYLITQKEGLPSSLQKEHQEPGIFFFNLIAARERILFESLLHSKTPQSQSLLFPITLTLSAKDMQTLELQLPLLNSVGIHIAQSGKTSFIIDAIPACLEEREVQDLIYELLGSEKSFEKEQLCKLMTKKSQLPHRSYSAEQGVKIIQDLFKTKNPHHCPKGHATYFFFKESDIEHKLLSH